MTLKEKFLSISTYEEFNRRRKEFVDLEMDSEVLEHAGEIFPKLHAGNEELFTTPRNIDAMEDL